MACRARVGSPEPAITAHDCGSESISQIARFLVHAEVYELGFDYVDKYPQYIRGITAEDIARVARKYLDSENYSLVVVGPVNGNDK